MLKTIAPAHVSFLLSIFGFCFFVDFSLMPAKRKRKSHEASMLVKKELSFQPGMKLGHASRIIAFFYTCVEHLFLRNQQAKHKDIFIFSRLIS